MKTTLRFFKINEGSQAGWYADVQGHTLAENQMVSGSDDFLETVDSLMGSRGEVTMTIADDLNDCSGSVIASLTMRSHNQWGATYTLSGPAARRYHAEGFELWICNVTHDVLGGHPRNIYINHIS